MGGAIEAILRRRDLMVEEVERMVEGRGRADVFVRFDVPAGAPR